MLEFSSLVLILISIAYPPVFIGTGMLKFGEFLNSKIDLKKPESATMIKYFQRGEEISFILSGFAIVSLIFVITLFEGHFDVGESMILLFSLAFIFEIMSAFIYHGVDTFRSFYVGAAFQYGGILTMMCGFFSYLLVNMDWSLGIYLIFIFGILSIFALTYIELSRDGDLSKEYLAKR